MKESLRLENIELTHQPTHEDVTSVICPSSEELIAFSMFALKFHLKIDIKELSLTNSKSGKDLPKKVITSTNYLKISVPAGFAIITRGKERIFL